MMCAARSTETSEQTCYSAFCKNPEYHLNNEYFFCLTLLTYFLCHRVNARMNEAKVYLLC